MKKEIKKKKSWNWFSVTAFIISILAFGIACCRLLPEFTSSSESFISVLVALLALCVTFAIGYQIVNTLEIKESVKEIKRFEAELESTKKELINVEHRIQTDRHNSEGIAALNRKEYTLALCLVAEGLYHALCCDYKDRVSLIMHNMDVIFTYWKNDKSYNHDEYTTEVNNQSPKDRALELFDIIINDCSEYLLYDLCYESVRNYKTKYLEMIKEHQKESQNGK